MRLNNKMGDGTKQVRVDNWGIFFLQRLQTFFSKTDYCDMTLQFDGNVQLKVHRLVLNACTEYFRFLEQTCGGEENTILMPADLQADVIVPIVNFMYTGMLEFHLSIFEKLYKTAQLMNITILMKLMEAQKPSISAVTLNTKSLKKKVIEPIQTVPVKKPPKNSHSDLPAPLPGRKLPVWKRKSVPSPAPSDPQTSYPLFVPPAFSKWASNYPADPLSVPDNAPKPTRFEWPEEDLPPMNMMDTSFDEISYTSKPLMTQEEEQRATAAFEDPLRNSKKQKSSSVDMEEVKDYVKEQRIRSGLCQEDEEEEAEEEEEEVETGKRKATDQKGKAKKVRFEEGKQATISITMDGKNTDLDHEKIVAELLKKYPQLVKKNKKIQLKIMAKNKVVEVPKVDNIQVKSTARLKEPERGSKEPKTDEKTPWTCERCSTDDEPVEFVLYYLYRKHMTDVHSEKFDSKLCKYCGQRCNKHNLLMYHLYTKHGIKPPPAYTFPKCELCPHIALSPALLNKHKLRHGKNEIQCVECKLAFSSQGTLTSHMQITGHTGKTKKSNYDCQYCTKRFNTGVNLFTHVKSQHRNEAIRDGIVSIDESDDVDDFEDEEGESKDEYILPEIISDAEVPKKVNILSNVKVSDSLEQREVTLEPSSEAEALNNVATGIATSLGLVDIVVLNDNQQLFLPTNQQSEQPEFILPELTAQTSEDVAMGDIGSTDELVMVLTDHDYGDNQEDITSENSNIVVLYSHPVDGDQGQFLTSQSNLMMNSQGMIEIRNGEDQVIVSPQVESIEMIQREIEGHGEMKEENLEEDSKSNVEEGVKGRIESEPLIESLTQGKQLEFVTNPIEEDEPTETDKTEEPKDNSEEPRENVEEEKTPEEETKEVEEEKQNEEEMQETEEEREKVNEEDREEREEIREEERGEIHEEEKEETNEEEKEEVNEEIVEEERGEIDKEDKEPPTSQLNEENSQSSEESKEKEEGEENSTPTKIAILDDWEDTDSQQSGSNKEEGVKVAGETVGKLMDDWEEEEEDDGRKDGD